MIYGGIATVALLAVGLAAAHGGGFGRGAGFTHDAQAPTVPFCRGQQLTESGGAVTGNCIAFTADPAAGTVDAFTLTINGTSTVLVDGVNVPALAGGSESVQRDYVLSNGDVRFMARDGPGFAIASRNGTAASIAFPADAVVVVHDAVADWSGAGATITIGAMKLNLLLPAGSTVAQDGNTLNLQLGPGAAVLAPVGHPLPGDRPFGDGPRPEARMDGAMGRGPRGHR